MAKDPAFLFYTQDFLTGTMFMSNEQTGIYIKLLCAQHQHGGIIDKTAFENVINGDSIIRSKFIEVDDGFYNKRLFDEMLKRKKKSSSLSANALIRWEKEKQKQCKSNANASDLNMPIEDENKDETKDKYRPIEDCLFWNDSDFKEAWRSRQLVRTKKKCSNSDRAIKMVVKKLMQLSDGKKEKAIQIIDNSANGGWTDIYELKVEHGKSDKKWSEKEKAMNQVDAQKITYPNYSYSDIINGLNVSEEIKAELKVLYKEV